MILIGKYGLSIIELCISIIVSKTELWIPTIVVDSRYSYPNMDIHNSLTIYDKHRYPYLSRIIYTHIQIWISTFQLWIYIYDQIMDTKIMDTIIKSYI